jgi:hypothetical protein
VKAIRSWIIAAGTVDLVIIWLWLAAAALRFESGGWGDGVWLRLVLAFSWFVVVDNKISARLKPNQAVVTAPTDRGPLHPIEPSSDMRQAARAMTEMRASLIHAGYTPEQASRQIADVIAASNQGES